VRRNHLLRFVFKLHFAGNGSTFLSGPSVLDFSRDNFKGVPFEFLHKLGLRIEFASIPGLLRWVNVGITLSGVFVARI